MFTTERTKLTAKKGNYRFERLQFLWRAFEGNCIFHEKETNLPMDEQWFML